MSDNNCNRLGLPSDCAIPLTVQKCAGFVDANGDGKDDFAIVAYFASLKGDGYEILGPNNNIIYNGIDPARFKKAEEYIETLRQVPQYRTDGTIIVPGDTVEYNGKRYIVEMIEPGLYCSENKISVDRSKTMVALAPAEIQPMIDVFAKSNELKKARAESLKEKYQKANNDEKEALLDEYKRLIEEFSKNQVDIALLTQRKAKEAVICPLDDVVPVKP